VSDDRADEEAPSDKQGVRNLGEKYEQEEFDPTEEFEPEEFDPDTDIGPDGPEIPEAPDFSESAANVSPDLLRAFWKLVAIFNLALFATSLGLMLIAFRGELVRGGGVFLLGAVTFVYGYVLYQRKKPT
jgi:hypothetical protein